MYDGGVGWVRGYERADLHTPSLSLSLTHAPLLPQKPHRFINVLSVNILSINEQDVKTRRAMCVYSNIGNKGKRATSNIVLFEIQSVDINITRNMIKCFQNKS